MKKQTILLFGFLLAFVCLLPLISNIIRYENLCLNGVDFGAYHAAMVDMVLPTSLDPVNPVNGIGMMSDHFEVGLWLLSPVIHLAKNSAIASLFMEWFLWLLAGAILVWLGVRRDIKYFFWIAFLYAGAKGLVEAIDFPIHPSFWSIPLWVLFVWSLFQRRNALCFLSVALISCFKESYGLSFLPFSLFLLIDKKNRKLGIGLVTFLILVNIWNFKLRALAFGPTSNFTTRMLGNLIEHPVQAIQDLFQRFPYRLFIEIYLSVILFFVISFQKNRKITLMVLLALLPLIGIHIWTALIGRHYAFVFVSCGLACAIFSEGLKEKLQFKKWKYVMFTAGVLPGVIGIFHPLELFIRDNDYECPISSELRNEFSALQEKYEQIPITAKIGVTGDLLPNLYGPGRNLFQLLHKSPIQKEYDYLILRRSERSKPYPMTREQVLTVISSCAPFISEKIFESENFILWKGPFPWKCIYQWPSEAVNQSQFPM
jgi:hypothetical protein